jgi:hypothetical protein
MFACVDLTSCHLSECNYSWDHVTKICNTQIECNLGFCSGGYEAYCLLVVTLCCLLGDTDGLEDCIATIFRVEQ